MQTWLSRPKREVRPGLDPRQGEREKLSPQARVGVSIFVERGVQPTLPGLESDVSGQLSQALG